MTSIKQMLNFTLVGFVAILWLKLIYPASSGLPDTDFFWHLEYGRWILEHGALPSGDTFSWTHTGRPYQLTQWLGEVLLAAAYQAGGPLGTTLLATVLCAITIGAAWRSAARHVASPVALTLAVLCNAIMIVMAMRPQMFSFAATAIAVLLLLSWDETGKRRYAILYCALMALWVNLHGAFVVGLLLAGLLFAGRVWDGLLARQSGKGWQPAVKAGLLVVGSTLATCANPYGFDALLNVFMIGGLKSALVISEWKPVLLTTATGWFYLMFAVPFIALLVLSPGRLNASGNLLVAFALLFAIQANRQVAIGGAIMAPFIAMLLSRSPQYATMRQTIHDPARPILVLGIIAALAFVAIPIVDFGQRQMQRNLGLRYPVAATQFIVDNGLTTRLMSDTVEASYLIHKQIPVYIDGRMDLYRDAFFFRWWLAERGAPGWHAVIKADAPNAVLLRRTAALRQLMLVSDWKLVFDDNRYSVLAPSTSPLPAVAPVAVAYQAPDGAPSPAYLE